MNRQTKLHTGKNLPVPSVVISGALLLKQMLKKKNGFVLLLKQNKPD